MMDDNDSLSAQMAEVIQFTAEKPQRFVLLVARVGALADEVLPPTRNFRPKGTEFATQRDLAVAGFVAKSWKEGLLSVAREIQRTKGAETLVEVFSVLPPELRVAIVHALSRGNVEDGNDNDAE